MFLSSVVLESLKDRDKFSGRIVGVELKLLEIGILTKDAGCVSKRVKHGLVCIVNVRGPWQIPWTLGKRREMVRHEGCLIQSVRYNTRLQAPNNI
jgi:hypothetical protein